MLLPQSHPYLVHSFCWDSAERWSCLILSASLPPPAAELALVFGIRELFVAVVGASHCAILCSSNQARSRRHPVFGMIYLKHVSVLSWPGALWKRKGNSALRSKWKCSLSWWDGEQLHLWSGKMRQRAAVVETSRPVSNTNLYASEHMPHPFHE